MGAPSGHAWWLGNPADCEAAHLPTDRQLPDLRHEGGRDLVAVQRHGVVRIVRVGDADARRGAHCGLEKLREFSEDDSPVLVKCSYHQGDEQFLYARPRAHDALPLMPFTSHHPRRHTKTTQAHTLRSPVPGDFSSIVE